MAANNSVHLIGHLARDVEVRVTPKGTEIGSFTIAVNRKWKDDSGQLREEVSFIDCEMWGKCVALFAEYHRKGSKAAVAGRLKQDTWEDKETKQKRSKLKVVVDEFEFVNSKPAGGGEEGGDETRQYSAPPARRPAPAAPSHNQGLEDDVPF